MIYEKTQVMLTRVVAISPVVSVKLDYNTNTKSNDAKFCNDYSIVTSKSEELNMVRWVVDLGNHNGLNDDMISGGAQKMPCSILIICIDRHQ
jgi:hypothetical protein